MNLINKYKDSKYENLHEYQCELTEELDKLAGFESSDEFSFKHYILADNCCIASKCLAIRVPGGTVGGVTFDSNNIVTGIEIDTDYVVKSYPKDINERLKTFIGCKIDNL